MNFFRKILPLVTLTAILVSLAYLANAAAPGAKLTESLAPYTKGVNKHNLSASNVDATYRALADVEGDTRGTQICIFCHTPHSANVVGQAPLWNRNFSSETFQRYTSDTLKIRGIAEAQYGDGAQPNGSSKLCLSCHDGVSKLGDLYTGPDIVMTGSGTRDNIAINSLASFNTTTNKMLFGHHPVSFVYMTNFNYKLAPQTGTIIPGLPASYRFEQYSSEMPASSGVFKVKLFDTNRNGNGWMQCTTCHNPHQNQSDETGSDSCYISGGGLAMCSPVDTRKVAPFWVYHGGPGKTASDDAASVCRVCHALGAPSAAAPWPLSPL